MTMAPSSISPDERARKMNSMVLQRLSPDGMQRNLAVSLGVSESTVSRQKEHLEPLLKLLSYLGLKLVDEAMVCVRVSELEFLRKSYAKTAEQAPWLLNEGDQ